MDSVFHAGWVYWEGASLEVQEHLEAQARNSVALKHIQYSQASSHQRVAGAAGGPGPSRDPLAPPGTLHLGDSSFSRGCSTHVNVVLMTG